MSSRGSRMLGSSEQEIPIPARIKPPDDPESPLPEAPTLGSPDRRLDPAGGRADGDQDRGHSQAEGRQKDQPESEPADRRREDHQGHRVPAWDHPPGQAKGEDPPETEAFGGLDRPCSP